MSDKELKLKPLEDAEIVHHSDDQFLIFSKFNKIHISVNGEKDVIELPLSLHHKILGRFRMLRRLLRLDKSSVRLAQDRSTIVVTYRSNVYCYTLATKTLKVAHQLKHCKTVMHMSIASLEPKTLILGEYGSNPDRSGVPIYLSEDGGLTWSTPCVIENVRHIHGVYHDPFTDHIWVATGDFQGECFLFEYPDKTFENPIVHGDGSQIWRTVNLFFSKQSVVWIMDSQLETSHLVTMNRNDNSIDVTQPFPGPVWYIKTLSDNIHLAQTTVEIGEGVHTGCAHIYYSTDLAKWENVASFRHDGWSLKYFKFGVISFSNGVQKSDKFYISCEAIKNMDGKSYECSLVDKR